MLMPTSPAAERAATNAFWRQWLGLLLFACAGGLIAGLGLWWRSAPVLPAVGVMLLLGAALAVLRPVPSQPVPVDTSEPTPSELLHRATRERGLLEQAIRLMAHASDERVFLHELAGLLTAAGGYRLAWFGRVEADAAKSVTVLASSGAGAAEVSAADATWAQQAAGLGPVGRCICNNKQVVVENLAAELGDAPWRAAVLRHHLHAVAALPLRSDRYGHYSHVLAVYAHHPSTLDSGELALLSALADCATLALCGMGDRSARAAAELALSPQGSPVARPWQDIGPANRPTDTAKERSKVTGTLHHLPLRPDSEVDWPQVRALFAELTLLVRQDDAMSADLVRSRGQVLRSALGSECQPALDAVLCYDLEYAARLLEDLRASQPRLRTAVEPKLPALVLPAAS